MGTRSPSEMARFRPGKRCCYQMGVRRPSRDQQRVRPRPRRSARDDPSRIETWRGRHCGSENAQCLSTGPSGRSRRRDPVERSSRLWNLSDPRGIEPKSSRSDRPIRSDTRLEVSIQVGFRSAEAYASRRLNAKRPAWQVPDQPTDLPSNSSFLTPPDRPITPWLSQTSPWLSVSSPRAPPRSTS